MQLVMVPKKIAKRRLEAISGNVNSYAKVCCHVCFVFDYYSHFANCYFFKLLLQVCNSTERLKQAIEACELAAVVGSIRGEAAAQWLANEAKRKIDDAAKKKKKENAEAVFDNKKTKMLPALTTMVEGLANGTIEFDKKLTNATLSNV